jgi:hypothetical protein
LCQKFSMVGAQDITTVYESERLRALCSGAHRRRLIVTFDHFNACRVGFPTVTTSRHFAAAGWGQLMIATACNDWYLNPDLPALRQALAVFTATRTGNRALGFSMGAFGALLLGDVLRLEATVLVSTQISPFPENPPHEERWVDWVEHLDRSQMRIAPSATLGDIFALYDPHHVHDTAHAKALALQMPEAHLCAMPRAGHPATNLVSRARRLVRLQRLMTSARIDSAKIHALHRVSRPDAPEYWEALESWAGQRRPGLARLAARKSMAARLRLAG